MLLALAVVLVVEVVRVLPLADTFGNLATVAGKAVRVVGSQRISDHWKEKVLLAYAGQIFVNTLKSCLLLLVAMSPVVLLVGVAQLLAIPLWALLLSPLGIAGSTLVGVVYGFVRVRRGR